MRIRADMSNLRKMIMRRGLKMADVARMMRKPGTTVQHNCVRGVSTISLAQRYAEVLKCPAYKLMGFGNDCR